MSQEHGGTFHLVLNFSVICFQSSGDGRTEPILLLKFSKDGPVGGLANHPLLLTCTFLLLPSVSLLLPVSRKLSVESLSVVALAPLQ